MSQTASAAEKKKETWLLKLMSSSFDELKWGSKRKRIIYEQNGKCAKCGISEWLGKPLTLEVDHKNGVNDDDRRENLEALCPNCHSITDTWRGRNKPSKIGETQIDDVELLHHLKQAKNIRQGLLAAGLAAKGNNYARAKRLMENK